MNPLIATLVAALASVVAGLTAATAKDSVSRAATAAGGAITIGAAGLCALPLLIHGQEAVFAIGPLALRADALTATLLFPLGLITVALALGLPRRMTAGRVLGALSLAMAAVMLGLVADNVLGVVIAELLATGVVVWGMDNPGKPRRLAAIVGPGLSAVLAVAGVGVFALSDSPVAPLSEVHTSAGAAVLLLLAAAVRLGIAPFQTSLTSALAGVAPARGVLLALPLGGVLLLVRIVQPGMADMGWGSIIGPAVLTLSLLSALIAIVTDDLGRATGWTLAALNGLLVVGNIEAAETGALGGGLLWAALILSEGGFGLAVLLVTRRLGAVDLRRMHGLQASAPTLSVAFLLIALSIAGAPGTLEFIAEDVLLNGASSPGVMGALLMAAIIAAVGFNALRLTFQVFFGPPPKQRTDMDASPREKIALAAVVGVMVAGGVAPGLLPLVARASELAAGLH
jgi:formate hydrogenlyase subunit 3/multisubunit Na+/H+ antiporter MnhD subunit